MLYVFSGEVPELNANLLEKLGRKHTLTVIPASPRDMASAKHVTEYFRQEGLRARLKGARYYHDEKRLRQIIKNSDAVYLMGGNTFEFLAYAQRIDLFLILSEFEKAGGIILAESAGSIILTPNISTALIPTTCPDDHELDLESYTGMGRISFHVSPHFNPDISAATQELDELQALAYYSKIPVMVYKDGEGFIMEEDQIVHTVGQPGKLKTATAPSASIDVESLLPTWVAEVP